MTTAERPARGARAVVRVPGEGRTIALGDAGIVTLKATGADTDGTVSAYEFAVPPQTAGPPVHLHRNWHETFYVLAGEMTFLIDGERRDRAGRNAHLHPLWGAAHVLERG